MGIHGNERADPVVMPVLSPPPSFSGRVPSMNLCPDVYSLLIVGGRPTGTEPAMIPPGMPRWGKQFVLCCSRSGLYSLTYSYLPTAIGVSPEAVLLLVQVAVLPLLVESLRPAQIMSGSLRISDLSKYSSSDIKRLSLSF